MEPKVEIVHITTPVAKYTLDYNTGAIKAKPIITNADRIRSMTDEELANKMSGLESFALTCGGGWPPEKWLDWLKEESK